MTNSLSGQDQRTNTSKILPQIPLIQPQSQKMKKVIVVVCARLYVRERDLGRVNGGLKIQVKLHARTWERERVWKS